MSGSPTATMSAAERKIACNICRRRKTACDRKKPRCSLCAKSNLSCEYSSQERQPGLRAGYVSKLEERIAQLENRVGTVEGQVLDPTLQTPRVGRPATQHGDLGDTVHPAPGADSSGPSFDGVSAFASMDASDPLTFSPPGLPIDGNCSPEIPTLDNGPLADVVISELCSVWFHSYHRWFPILHEPSFAQILQDAPRLAHCARRLVVHAIVAVTIQHSQHLPQDAKLRRDWQESLEGVVITKAMNTATLESLQALLILSVISCGEGKTTQAANLFAVCRRISARLGIVEFSIPQRTTTGTTPIALRRPASANYTSVDQEEKLRAFWMTEMLDSLTHLGAKYSVGLPDTPLDPVLPCSDTVWGFPEDIMREQQLPPSPYHSAFSLCIIHAVSELPRVHDFLRKPVNMADYEQRDAWQSEAQRIDERLTTWRDEFVAAVFRLINAEYAYHERPEMDSYTVMTNCILNSAVITLLQRRAPCPPGIAQLVEPWAFASNRCIYACENMAFKVRQMEENELLTCHPHLIPSLFTAARFYIVHSRALDADVPSNLHSLAFALHTCGKRWPLADVFEKTIRTAVAEYRSPVATSGVPHEFYDLQNSTFDIMDSLIAWAEAPKSTLTSAVDPYMTTI